MSKHLVTGKKGEEIAEEYLTELGFEILERNWRDKKLEIDLIARDQETLVFVEVKTRSTDFFGQPEIFVGKSKEQRLIKAASTYVHLVKHDWAIRFDVIAVVLQSDTKYKVKHIKDAFFPGLS